MERRALQVIVGVVVVVVLAALTAFDVSNGRKTADTVAVAPPPPAEAPAPPAEVAAAPAPSATAAASPTAAPAPGTEVAALPSPPPAATQAPPSGPVVPSFDVVRVEPSGDTVVAGQAEPNSKVEILDGDTTIATAEASENGEWALPLDKPLAPGTHDLAIRTTNKDDTIATLSDQRVTVSVPAPGSKDVLVVVNTPDAASKVLEAGGTATADATPPAGPGVVAEAQPTTPNATATAEATPTPASGTTTAEAAPAAGATAPGATATAEATPPAAANAPGSEVAANDQGSAPATAAAPTATAEGSAGEVAAATPGAPAPGAAGSAPSPVASPAEQQTAEATPPKEAPIAGEAPITAEPKIATEAPIAAEPAIKTEPPIATEPPAVALAAPAVPPAPPAPQPNVAVAAVEADTAGNVYIAGTAATGETVRVYIDDQPLGEAKPSPSGTWLVQTKKDMPAGNYNVRADQLGSDGTVIARAEVPFQREVDVAVLTPTGTAGGGDNGATVSGAMPMETVIIKHGDNLWRIARGTWGKGVRWSTIYQANTDQIRNPHWIYPGQVFIMPKGNITWTD